MQCSCGGATKTSYYQRTIKDADGGKRRQYGSQEVCESCGRATALKISNEVEVRRSEAKK